MRFTLMRRTCNTRNRQPCSCQKPRSGPSGMHVAQGFFVLQSGCSSKMCGTRHGDSVLMKRHISRSYQKFGMRNTRSMACWVCRAEGAREQLQAAYLIWAVKTEADCPDILVGQLLGGGG